MKKKPPLKDFAALAAKRKSSMSVGLVVMGAFALTAGGIYEATRRQSAARDRACAEALARGQTNAPECRASNSSSRSSSHFFFGGSSGASSSGASGSSSTQGVHTGGFGATGASFSHGGS